MAIAIKPISRQFEYNGLKLADPNPAFTPEQVKEVHSATYPELATAEIEPPVTEGDVMKYRFVKAVGTKG